VSHQASLARRAYALRRAGMSIERTLLAFKQVVQATPAVQSRN
jgi:hypothetical protein